jgi:NAD(P)-dependent dehydrogenase (short-subunit alcohol dehydrogenase family)
MSDTALITGGAGALGSELARTLVQQGYKVALCDTPRATSRLAELAATLGENVTTATGAFDSHEAWSRVLADVNQSLGGPVTHAVLVAGGWAGGSPFHETDDAVWADMMSKNLESAHHALAALLPPMIQAKRGSIVVIGSRAVERPWTSTNAAAYAASKSAVVTLSQVVAQEVLAHGVRVNAVLPSTMDTAANRKAMPNVDPSIWVSLPSAAGVIAFLLSEAARDVSGAVLPIYGRA